MKAVIRKYIRKGYMYLCYITRPRKKKIVFFASMRGQYSDNPRAISECLHRMAPGVRIVWMVKSKFMEYVPFYAKIVPASNPRKALKAQAQANVWVLNFTERKNLGVYKGRDTFYIQTWHGDRGLKTIGYLTVDNKNDLDGPDMSDCDLFVAASDYGVRKAQQGLLYDGEMIVEGMPRNDKLVNISKYSDEAAEVRKRLKIDSDVKVMLYAPTFRDEKKSQQCAIDIPASIANLEAKGEKWICLVRSHARSKGISATSNQPSAINYKDVTSYPDMADLLLITDLLITDYSSCAGDFLLTGKPLVLAHFDRNDYEAKDRSLWINPEEAGYLIAKNQDELNHILSNLYSYDHQAIADKVNHFYGTKETGHSAEAVARRILKELNIK